MCRAKVFVNVIHCLAFKLSVSSLSFYQPRKKYYLFIYAGWIQIIVAESFTILGVLFEEKNFVCYFLLNLQTKSVLDMPSALRMMQCDGTLYF